MAKQKDEPCIPAEQSPELVKDNLLRHKAIVRFPVKGFSMSPFIKSGDIVTILSSPDSIGLGAVAAFIDSLAGKVIIHRVVGKRQGQYLIKADMAFGSDGLISKQNILGKVIRLERKEKKITFGFGPERYLIALLSRHRILFLLNQIRRMIFKRR